MLLWYSDRNSLGMCEGRSKGLIRNLAEIYLEFIPRIMIIVNSRLQSHSSSYSHAFLISNRGDDYSFFRRFIIQKIDVILKLVLTVAVVVRIDMNKKNEDQF